jgi:phage terminase small subunit
MTKRKGLPSEFTQDQKHREFARQYLLDFKRVDAYRRCNFKTGGAKPSDSAAASKLLATTAVQQYIQEFSEERAKGLEVTAERIFTEWARVGFSDIRNYFWWKDGEIHLKDSAMLDENASRGIERLEITEYESPTGVITRRTKIKLHSKDPALTSMAKALGMYTEKHQVVVIDEREQVRDELLEMLTQTGDRLKSRGYTANGSHNITE